MNNFLNARKNKKYTQQAVADILQISRQAYSTYEIGTRSPDPETLIKLSKIFDCTVDYLLGIEAAPTEEKSATASVTTIKVFEKIPVNIEDIDAIPYAIDKMVISQEMAEDGNKYLGLLVQDDAMFSEYYDGDIVIVKPGNDMQNGDDVVVSVGNSNAKIRRIQKMSGGIRLKTLNPAYESEYFSNEDIEKLPVSIIGTIVEMRRIKK